MIELKDRQLAILLQLLNNDRDATIENLSNKFDVSSRTIYYDLNNLEEFLLSNNCQLRLDNKTRNYYIVGNLFELNNKLRTLNLEAFQTNRKKYIFKKLFINRETISYNELSTTLFVSRTTIYNDINEFKEQVKYYDLEIQSNNRGTFVFGKELNIQKYCLGAILNYRFENKKHKIEVDEIVHELFPKYISDTVYSNLHKLNSQLDYKIQPPYFVSLYLRLILFIHFSLNGFKISKNCDRELDEVINFANNSLINNFIANLSKEFQLMFDENEFEFIYNLLLGYGADTQSKRTDTNRLSAIIVDESLKDMSEMLGIDFFNDERLKRELIFHIEIMIHRLELELTIYNPLLQHLKSEYPVVFNATWYVFSTLMNRYKLKISEEEVSYLMVHFQSSIERNASSANVLFISPSGIGISNLALTRLQNTLPKFVNITHVSKLEKESIDFEKYDFVISTVDIDYPEKFILNVSPLIDSVDKMNVINSYNALTLENKSKLSESNFIYLKKVIDREFIYPHLQTNDKVEAITTIVNAFYEAGYVKKGCLDSILEREKMGDTALENGVAIPHSNLEYVNKSCIGIVTFKEPIVWGSTNVSLAFVICIAEQDLKFVKDILTEIEFLANSSLIVKKIACQTNRDDIYNYLFE